MSDQLIETLRAADPARRMPAESAAAREATRESVLASRADTAPRAHSLPAPRSALRRRLVVVALAAALLIVVIPSAAWAYFSYFGDRETVLDEYHAAQKQMSLPAGATWKEPDLPADAVYGSRAGYIAAWAQSTDAWLREWVAARDAGDASRQQDAITAVDRQISLMPLHKDGDPEEAGGFVKESLTYFQGLVDKAKQGDFWGIEEYLQAN